VYEATARRPGGQAAALAAPRGGRRPAPLQPAKPANLIGSYGKVVDNSVGTWLVRPDEMLLDPLQRGDANRADRGARSDKQRNRAASRACGQDGGAEPGAAEEAGSRAPAAGRGAGCPPPGGGGPPDRSSIARPRPLPAGSRQRGLWEPPPLERRRAGWPWRNVSIEYGAKRQSKFGSLRSTRGRWLALIGPSGCGKTNAAAHAQRHHRADPEPRGPPAGPAQPARTSTRWPTRRCAAARGDGLSGRANPFRCRSSTTSPR